MYRNFMDKRTVYLFKKTKFKGVCDDLNECHNRPVGKSKQKQAF